MNSASSSNGLRRSPRLGKNLVSSSGQSSWNPDRLEQEDATNSLSEEQEPLPIVRVLLRKMKVSREGTTQVTGGEAGVRENRNQMNAGGNARAPHDDSVIELDQEDHEIDSSRQNSNPNDLSSIDLSSEMTNELRAGPSASGVAHRHRITNRMNPSQTSGLTNSSGGIDNSSSGPLPLPGPSQVQTEMLDVITIDDEEDPGQSSDEDIMIFSPSPHPHAAAQDTNTLDSLNDASNNPHHMPPENENNTTIDLTNSDSPLPNKVKAAGSSSNASSVPESSPVAFSPEPLTCPVCFESYVALCKGNVKIWFLECGHVFCGPCLQECLRRRQQCPVCRASVRRGDPRQLFL